MKIYSELFFESYNRAVEAAYDAFLNSTEGDFSRVNENRENDDREKKLNSCLQSEYTKWLDTPLETLGGKTPEEYVETVNGLSRMTEMFTYGAVACDDELPEVFIDKLRDYGENAIDMLLETAAQNGINESDERFLVPLMAVKVLGKWKVERAVVSLIRLLNTEGEVYDLMYETVRDALVRIDDGAIDGICAALNSRKLSQTAVEYLIMALADIGKEKRCDKIFLQLKRAFLEMTQKIIAANCLGNYGDGRAIPALRGYLDKNGQQLDKETFCEIVSAIKRLGGRTDGLGTHKQ